MTEALGGIGSVPYSATHSLEHQRPNGSQPEPTVSTILEKVSSKPFAKQVPLSCCFYAWRESSQNVRVTTHRWPVPCLRCVDSGCALLSMEAYTGVVHPSTAS